MTNADALEQTIEALELHEEDAALVQHARTLASTLDAWPLEVKLHSEYREVCRRLVAAGQSEKLDVLAALLAELRD